MGQQTNNPNTPRYWGTSLTDMAEEEAAKGKPLGLLAGAAVQGASADTRNGWEKAWDGFLNMLNGFLSMVFKAIFPNSTAAETGINARISDADIYDTIEQDLGLEGIAGYMRAESKAAARDFNSFGFMPKEEAAVANAKKVASTHHDKMVEKITSMMVDKYKGRYSDDEIEVIAQNAASLASGINVDDAISSNRAARIAASTPTHGLVALLSQTAQAVGTEGRARDSYHEADVPAFAVNNAALAAMRAGMNKQGPAPTTPQTAPSTAIDPQIEKLIGDWLTNVNTQNKAGKDIAIISTADVNKDGSVTTSEIIATLAGQGVTDTTQITVAMMDSKLLVTKAGGKLPPTRGI